MRKAVGSKKALAWFVLAIAMVLGALFPVKSAYAAIGDDDNVYNNYVYLYVDTDLSGLPQATQNAINSALSVNSSGWFTLGKVSRPSGMPTAAYGNSLYNNKDIENSYLVDSSTGQLLSSVGSISYVSSSASEQFNALLPYINWSTYGLTKSDGANDYVNSGHTTWHLDGKLTISYLFNVERYVINDDETTTKLDGPIVQPYTASDVTNNTNLWSQYESYDGYYFDHATWTDAAGTDHTGEFSQLTNSYPGAGSTNGATLRLYFKKYGKLTVTKNVTGLDSIPSDYSVTVSVKGSDSEAAQTYTFTSEDFSNGSASHTFENLKQGTYTVTETVNGAPTSYSQTQTYVVGTGTEATYPASGASVTISNSSLNPTVAFTNAYALKTGTLAISKTVSGGAANTAEDFTFELTDTALADKSYTYTKAGSDASETATVTFDSNGVAKIQLRHGQTATISGLPAGETISVKETGLTANAKTSTTVSVNGGDSKTVKDESSTANETDPVKTTIAEGQTQTLDFTNNADLQPDTGLNTTNSTPMIALLGAAAAGGLALAVTTTRKRNGERKES